MSDTVNGELAGVTSRHFSMADLGKELPARFTSVDGVRKAFRPAAPSFNIGVLFALMLAYLAFAWYFGQVFTRNQGGTRSTFFVLSPEYWGCSRRSTNIMPGDTLAVEQRRSAETDSVRAVKISKSYGVSPCPLVCVSVNMAAT